MSEWKEYKLEDVCSISSSKRIFAKEYQENGIPFYRGKEIIEKQKGIKISQPLYISETKYSDINQKFGVPEKGDMLLTSVGTLGVPYIVRDEKFYFKDGNITWFSDFKGMNNQYLYYWFLSPIAKNQITTKAIGSTQKALTIDTLKKFEISLPTINIQNRIVSILKSLDDKIELNRCINENLVQQAQALFKNWFVENVSNKWLQGTASDFYNITIGKTPPRKEQQWFTTNKQDMAWVSIADMGNSNVYIDESSEYLTCDAIDKFNIVVVPNNTVILSFKLTIGRIAITNGQMTTNEAIAHFKTRNDELVEYTYLYLKNYKFASLDSTSSIATAINSKIVKSMPWIMPDEKTLRSFHLIVKPLFNAIKKNINENKRLAELRDTLLPKLINGELNIDE